MKVNKMTYVDLFTDKTIVNLDQTERIKCSHLVPGSESCFDTRKQLSIAYVGTSFTEFILNMYSQVNGQGIVTSGTYQSLVTKRSDGSAYTYNTLVPNWYKKHMV